MHSVKSLAVRNDNRAKVTVIVKWSGKEDQFSLMQGWNRKVELGDVHEGAELEIYIGERITVVPSIKLTYSKSGRAATVDYGPSGQTSVSYVSV